MSSALCAQDDVDVVYVATPHQFHAHHTTLAFAHGKHVLLEKPMAITLDDCTAMIEAGQRAGRHLIVGHSHSFNRPVARVRELCERGDFGAVRMITAINFTDFLFRPRRPEELATESGGGVIFSQAAHQIDIVRLVGGGRLASVRASTGAWDPSRPTEGAYSALLAFENGAFAHATYSGYAHYDSDELMDAIGELGQPKSAADYGVARKRLDNAGDPIEEARLKAAAKLRWAMYAPPAATAPSAWNHFGFLVVCCDRADLRPTAHRVAIYADRERRFEPLPPPAIPRVEVIDELYRAIVEDEPPVHDGAWARATLEACLAILEISARAPRHCAEVAGLDESPLVPRSSAVDVRRTRRAGPSLESAAASDSSEARLCTGLKSSAYGNSARIPAGFASKPS